MIRDEFRIKEICKQQNITLADLAKKMNISPVAMAQLMSRENTTTDKLKEIADALGVKWWELINTGNTTDGISVICPHCGKPVSLCIDAKIIGNAE